MQHIVFVILLIKNTYSRHFQEPEPRSVKNRFVIDRLTYKEFDFEKEQK